MPTGGSMAGNTPSGREHLGCAVRRWFVVHCALPFVCKPRWLPCLLLNRLQFNPPFVPVVLLPLRLPVRHARTKHVYTRTLRCCPFIGNTLCGFGTHITFAATPVGIAAPLHPVTLLCAWIGPVGFMMHTTHWFIWWDGRAHTRILPYPTHAYPHPARLRTSAQYFVPTHDVHLRCTHAHFTTPRHTRYLYSTR